MDYDCFRHRCGMKLQLDFYIQLKIPTLQWLLRACETVGYHPYCYHKCVIESNANAISSTYVRTFSNSRQDLHPKHCTKRV